MKKELTIGDILTLLVVIVGWAISIEVRQATVKAQVNNSASTITEMSIQLKEIHESVVRHDERINADLPQIVTRGGIIKKKK